MTLLKLVTLLLLLHGRPTDDPRYGATQWTAALEAAQARYEIPPELMLAIAIHETRMNPRAIGAVGEIGPWQLHPEYKWGKDAKTLCGLDPRDCLDTYASYSAAYLSRMIFKCGSVAEGVAGYNRGHCGPAEEYTSRVEREYRYILELRGEVKP